MTDHPLNDPPIRPGAGYLDPTTGRETPWAMRLPLRTGDVVVSSTVTAEALASTATPLRWVVCDHLRRKAIRHLQPGAEYRRPRWKIEHAPDLERAYVITAAYLQTPPEEPPC